MMEEEDFQELDFDYAQSEDIDIPEGSGSGGGSQSQDSQPVDAEADLFGSGNIASLGVICEGRVEGFPSQIYFAGGLRSAVERHNFVKIDNTVLKYPRPFSQEPNFKGVVTKFRDGTLTQDPIPGYTDVSAIDVSVGVDVTTKAGQVTRTSTNTALDIIRLNVTVQLFKQENGLKPAPLVFEIYTQRNSEGYKLRRRVRLNNVATQPAPMSFDLGISNRGTLTSYSFRIKKITPDGDNARNVNNLKWLSYGELVQTARLNYAGTALMGMRISANAFSSFPDTAVTIHGMIGLQIPTGCTVRSDRSLDYTAVNWVGTTQTTTQAVNSIFAIIYEELTNPRINPFALTPAQINLASLFAIDKFNNELITDLDGVTRPRWRIAMYLNQQKSGFELLTDICSSCFADYYFDNGQINFVQHRTGLVETQFFTNANVVDGIFNYPETDESARYNSCTARWWNPVINEVDYETYEDQTDISLNGYKNISVEAIGAHTRMEAYRYAKAVVKMALLEEKRCVFEAAASGLFLKPGDRIDIFDEDVALDRYAGLIKAVDATRTVFTLDSPISTAAPGNIFRIILPDGIRQNLTVASVNLVTPTITTSTAATVAPLAETPWALSNAVQPQTFRVESIDFGDQPNTYRVSSIEYITNFWAVVEQDAEPLIPRIVGVEPQMGLLVRGLDIKLLEIDITGVNSAPDLYTVTSSWSAPLNDGQPTSNPFVSRYIAEIRASPDGDWGNRQTLTKSTERVYWYGLALGTYQTRIAVVDIYNRNNPWVYSGNVLAVDSALITTQRLVIASWRVVGMNQITLRMYNTGVTNAITGVYLFYKNQADMYWGSDNITPVYYGQSHWTSQTASIVDFSSLQNRIAQSNPKGPVAQLSYNPVTFTGPLTAVTFTIDTLGAYEIAIAPVTSAGTTTVRVIQSSNPNYFNVY